MIDHSGKLFLSFPEKQRPRRDSPPIVLLNEVDPRYRMQVLRRAMDDAMGSFPSQIFLSGRWNAL